MGADWAVEPLVVARIAGLPSSVPAELRFAESFAHAERVADLDETLAARAADLSDALYPVIGALPDPAAKPRLVALRRALHQVRTPDKGCWDEPIRALLPPAVTEQIQDWLSLLAQRDQLRSELPSVLAAEDARKEQVLRTAAELGPLRRGLAQASPSLAAEVGKWLADPRRTLRRQSRSRLAKFIARAAAKTSPYGAFMTSGTGVWTSAGPAVRLRWQDRPVSVLELDGLVVAALLRAVAEDPAVADAVPLRINPSLHVAGGAVTFLGRPPAESIVSMPLSPVLAECLKAVAEAGSGGTRAVTERLVAGTGAAAASVAALLAKLIGSGLLAAAVPVPDLSGDPLSDLLDWLRVTRPDLAAEVTPLIQAVREGQSPQAGPEDAAGHLAARERLHDDIVRLAARFGMPLERAGTLSHESVIHPGPVAELCLPRWEGALGDLDLTRRWLAVFEPGLARRLALGTYVRERFGAGAQLPFPVFLRAVHEAMAAASGGTATGAAALAGQVLDPAFFADEAGLWRADPGLDLLRELREQARAAMLPEPGADGVIRPEPDEVAKALGEQPAWVVPRPALSCYVQVVPGSADARLVLNVAGVGFGHGRGRVLALGARYASTASVLADQQLPDKPAPDSPVRDWPAPDWPVRDGDPVPAEFDGLFGTALNVRLPATRHEIDYPFTVGSRSEADRIPLSDLVVVHDPDTGQVRLRSQRLGREVAPLHLGLMTPVLLPPAARLLSLVFGGGYLVYPGLISPLSVDAAAHPGALVSHPRVELGGVVLRRRCWTVPADLVPRRAPGQTDAAFLIHLVAWLRGHGIPSRCFVHNAEAGPGTTPPGPRPDGSPWPFDKSRKPLYVDFADWFLVQSFEHMTAGTPGALVFAEALPDPDDATGAVAEYLLEITDGE